MHNKIIGQERVREVLERAIASDRVAHAYLFHGPDGVGKRAVALLFAQALQCERGGPRACGDCLPCRKVARMIHPDVHVHFPYPKDVDEHDIAERLALLAEESYRAIDFARRPSLSDPSKTSNKQTLYTVDRIHSDLHREMSFRPVEGRYKIAIVTDADRLRTEAANAFLKLLEEPGPQTVIVLTTSRPDQLLPTIISRCQRVHFDMLSPELIAAELIRRKNMDLAFAEALARMADGSMTRAIELAENEGLQESRDAVVRFLRACALKPDDAFFDLVGGLGKKGREEVKQFFSLVLSWARDLVLYRTLGPQAPIVNVDQREPIEMFCRNLTSADLDAMIQLVEEAIELIGRNVHTQLVLLALSQALAAAMKGPHDGRLYVPLVEPDMTV